MKIAEAGIEELAPHVDSLIVILNDKLEEVLGDDVNPDRRLRGRGQRVVQRGRRNRGHHPPGWRRHPSTSRMRTVMCEQGMAMMGASAAVSGPPLRRRSFEPKR